MKSFNLKKLLDKRVLTLVAMCLLLAGAVAANLLIGNDEKQAASTDPNEPVTPVSADGSTGQVGFFEMFRTERESVRTQELAYLDAIVVQGADEETLKDAQQQKLDLIHCMEMEVTVENLIRAKGFDEVIVSMHSGSINVIVGGETLTDEQVAQILDIVLRETGEKADNVKISTAQ